MLLQSSALYVNLFTSCDANVMVGKNKTAIAQKTDFPWTGNVEITLNPEKSGKFDIMIRVPGWALNEAFPGDLYKFTDKNIDPVKLSVNGNPVDISMVEGYAVLSRSWQKGDKISIVFPMPVRTIIADEKVKEDSGKVAFQRGPLIYTAEWPDNSGGSVLNLDLGQKAASSSEFNPDLLGGVEVIKTIGYQSGSKPGGKANLLKEVPVTLIPYALWNNRGPGEMRVWLPLK
jgi:uncharacterized protein